MKKIFILSLVILGCAGTHVSLAYTSSDCENAKELGYQNIINYQDSCKKYSLDSTATRQEVAAITLKIGERCGTIYNIPSTNQYYCNNIFADVGYRNPNNWVCRVVETLDREDILPESDYNTFGDRYFRPLKSITRAEALGMMLRGADIDYENFSYDSWRFTSSIPTKYRSLAQYAYDNDIISSINSFGASTSAYRRDIFNYAVKVIELCGNGSYGNNYNGNNYNYTYGNCGIGQYYSGNTCYSCGSLPTNASYIRRGSCDWQCNGGYTKSGSICVYNNGYQYNNCSVGQYSSNGVCYSCGTVPANGYYATAGSCSISCYSGYTYNSYTNSCTNSYNPGSCGIGQYWAGNMCLGCTTKSSYGYYTTAGTCDWQCNSGYYKSGNTCVSNYNNYSCGSGQYYSNGTCYSCGTLPYNAYYTSNGSCDWQCNSGYYRSGSSCISSNNYNYNTCGIGQYYTNGTCYSCSNAPYNGYYAIAGSCAITCNSGYTYNSYNNTCDYNGGGYYGGGSNCNTSVPANAYYTSGNCWSCNAGYVQVNNLCVWWGN